MKRYLKDVDPAVFWGSAVVIAGFVGWGLFAPSSLGSVMSTRADLGDRQLRLGVRPHRVRGAGAVHLPGDPPLGAHPARARTTRAPTSARSPGSR